MTIGIVSVTSDRKYIVVASDRMLSSGAIIQAADNAAMKMSELAKAWGVTFAASDANLFDPILARAFRNLPNLDSHLDYDIVSKAVLDAYRATFDEIFTSQGLSRLGYDSIQDFRSKARLELGEEAFKDILAEIAKFDLGIVFLGYGFDRDGDPHIFEVSNPGIIRDRHLINYAAIGSGVYMATAALRRRPPVGTLETVVYRTLEAKFSSETAAGVGRTTSLLILDKEGSIYFPEDDLIENMRGEWEKSLAQPDPSNAISVLKKLDIAKRLEEDNKAEQKSGQIKNSQKS
jgi:hypothetical protein